MADSETGKMRAIEIAEPGGPGVLRPVERDIPKFGSSDVLIRVSAAGVNRPDILQREGKYAPPSGVTDIPGLEVAGEVVAVGSEVVSPMVGELVMALVSGGGYAEYCVAPSGSCLKIPVGFSSIDAAAVPETFFTVWANVFESGRLQRGETLSNCLVMHQTMRQLQLSNILGLEHAPSRARSARRQIMIKRKSMGPVPLARE